MRCVTRHPIDSTFDREHATPCISCPAYVWRITMARHRSSSRPCVRIFFASIVPFAQADVHTTSRARAHDHYSHTTSQSIPPVEERSVNLERSMLSDVTSQSSCSAAAAAPLQYTVVQRTVVSRAARCSVHLHPLHHSRWPRQQAAVLAAAADAAVVVLRHNGANGEDRSAH